MKRIAILLLALAAVAVAFVASLRPDPAVDQNTFRGRFFTVLHRNGFITDVRLDLRGPGDTPPGALDAPTFIPLAMLLNPRHPLRFLKEGRRDYRLAHRYSDATLLCSVVFLDDSACVILIGAQPDAMDDADLLQSLLMREFPTLPVILRQCDASRPGGGGGNPPVSAPGQAAPAGTVATGPQYASVTFDPAKADFTIKNISTEAIAFKQKWWYDALDLMTLDEAENIAPVEYFRRHDSDMEMGGGPRPVQFVLKPGESITRACEYPMEAVIFLSARKRPLFGRFTGHVVATGRQFSAYSAPFPVPPQLVDRPWEPWYVQDSLDESYGWFPH